MGKIIALLLTLGLIGCGTAPVKVRTETVEVVKPILYCPAPDLTELGRPEELYIDSLTPESEVGDVAVKYKATVKQLIDYINRLELTLKEYEKFEKSYEELEAELKSKQNSE